MLEMMHKHTLAVFDWPEILLCSLSCSHTLSQINPPHTLTLCFVKSIWILSYDFCPGLPVVSFLQVCQQKCSQNSHLPQHTNKLSRKMQTLSAICKPLSTIPISESCVYAEESLQINSCIM